MINLIFNNLTAAGVATLMAAYRACPDYDETQNPSISMSARDYLTMLDNPAFGLDADPSAAAVFSAGTITNGNPDVHIPPVSPAAAFGGVIVKPEPVISMTEKAEGFDLQSYYDTGWSLEQLVEGGYAIVTQPATPVYGGDGGPNGQHATGTPSVPAPPSGPAAPPNAPAASGAPAHAPMLDTEGIPWDERIHAGTRTTTVAGAWKKKKGVDAAVVAAVTEELRALHAKPFTPLNAGANATGAAAPAPGAPVTATANAAPPPPASVTPTPAPAPKPPSAAPDAQAVPTSFPEFCKFVTSNGFSAAQIVEVCGRYGLPGLGRVAEPSNAALIPSLYQDFVALKSA